MTGQSAGCTWLRIIANDGEMGWISGNAAYTALDTTCELLPVVEATPTPLPTATPRRVAQGCATVTNQLGFEVRIEINRSDGWQASFPLLPDATRTYCVDPGTYTAILTAPARSDRFAVPLFVRGGESYIIPLRLP